MIFPYQEQIIHPDSGRTIGWLRYESLDHGGLHVTFMPALGEEIKSAMFTQNLVSIVCA